MKGWQASAGHNKNLLLADAQDMGIALDEANRMGLSLPGLALAKQLYVSLASNGGARLGGAGSTLIVNV